MKGLLIYLVIAIPVLGGGLFYLGDGEEEWAKMKEQEVVDHSMDGYHELKALQDELYDINGTDTIDNGIEVEEYLIANNIQYTSKDVNEDMDRYINITKGNWELEVLYHKADGTCCWITLSSLLYE